MVKPPVLAIEVDNEQNDASFQLETSCYRQDGITIGPDYLRVEGTTITRGKISPSALQVQEVIGTGAFSTVRRAIWSPYGSENSICVAVKEISITDPSQQRRKMLLRELRTLCRVENQGLVQFYGAFLSADAVAMVLEFMDRGSLDDLIQQREGPLNDEMIACAAYQILTGLAFLHKRRLLHRDLKPANVLVHSSGAVKLCDFGLATLGEQSMNTTVLGTTKFMAPERLRAKSYGRLSDCWSFGLVLLVCATGRPPFQSCSSLVELAITIEEEDMSLLVPHTLSCGLKEIICACLQVEPAKRIPSDLLVSSPWFCSVHRIQSCDQAQQRMKELLDNVVS